MSLVVIHPFRNCDAVQTDLGHAARKWTPTHRGFESFFGKYRGGGDHWTHQMAMNADTLSGGWWPGVDGSAGIDAEYRAPPVAQPIDLHRDIAGSHFEHVLWENGTHSTTLFGREAAAVVERHALAGADGAGISCVVSFVFRIPIRGMLVSDDVTSCLCELGAAQPLVFVCRSPSTALADSTDTFRLAAQWCPGQCFASPTPLVRDRNGFGRKHGCRY